MALDEDKHSRSEELDRVLTEEIDGYEPPTDEELSEWRESAPHPSEAVDYDSVGAETDGGADD